MRTYYTFLWALFCLPALLVLTGCSDLQSKNEEPIRVGVLHSKTGELSLGETSILNATILAIEEINARGGVLGRPIQPVVADGASNAQIFRVQAEHLVDNEHVVAIFGCLTSGCRKAVKDVVESRSSVLFYPMFYEGLEHSSNIVYMGAVPNQCVIPAITWAYQNYGPKFLVLGTHSVFSEALGELIREHLYALDGEIVDVSKYSREDYDFKGIIQSMQKNRPDVILSTQGTFLNEAFFHAVQDAGGNLEDIPVFLLGMSSMRKTPNMAGNYVLWKYYDSPSSLKHNNFVKLYRERYGDESDIAEPMESAYMGVHLWAKAVSQAGSAEPTDVLRYLPDQSVIGPNGVVYISPTNQHAYRIGQIHRLLADGKHEVVWESDVPLPPEPYPLYKSPQEWDRFIDGLPDSMRM